MPRGTKRPRDPAQLAKLIVAVLSGCGRSRYRVSAVFASLLADILRGDTIDRASSDAE
jgi:hypothetical protein